jgi:hypothetical protein
MFQFGKGELEKIRENDPKPGSVDEADGSGFKMPKMPWDK